MKRDWKGSDNYYPSNKNFNDYEHPGLGTETEKLSWENLVSKRKEETENELTKIFDSGTAVAKVQYLGRMRYRFPCLVTACKFNNVDLAKYLCAKHKWSNQAPKLQVNSFNVKFDNATRIKTYGWFT